MCEQQNPYLKEVPMNDKNEMKYGAWNISIDDGKALAELPDKSISIPLDMIGNGVLFEGFYGQHTKPKCVICGVCLFDARWMLTYPKRGKGNPPACKSPALPRERQYIFEN